MKTADAAVPDDVATNDAPPASNDAAADSGDELGSFSNGAAAPGCRCSTPPTTAPSARSMFALAALAALATRRRARTARR
jgi:MYXO-CTERM domain-containing protein